MSGNYRPSRNCIVIGTGRNGRQLRLDANDMVMVVAVYGQAHPGIYRACRWWKDPIEALRAAVDAWEADPTVAGADDLAITRLEGALDDARRLVRRRKQGGAS